MKIFPLVTISSLLSMLLFFKPTNDPPVELGSVNWLRDMDQAVQQSKATDKPILILFQEVPGCMTCQRYGQGALSHPLIVEAIEDLFVPLAIYNNKKGKDAKILAYYDEPSWNNPVVRVVNSRQADIVPRLSADYSPSGLVGSMIKALKKSGKQIPGYLSLLQEELSAQKSGTETATFSMYCFWTGEKTYGQLNGVVDTKAGFMNGREVVEVTYDPQKISYESLLKTGQRNSCADRVFTNKKDQERIASKQLSSGKVGDIGSFRADKEPKYYLSKTHYHFIPMLPIQAARANALIGQRKRPDMVLSPRQLAWEKYIRNNPKKGWKSMIDADFLQGVRTLEKIVAKNE